MRVWIAEATEWLPIDEGERPLRCGMLTAALLARGHEVCWWSSTFHHARKIQRFNAPQTIAPRPGLTLRLLHGPGYRRNLSLGRMRHNRVIAQAFAREARAQPMPDVIFACTPTPELAEQAVELGRRQACPVVIDVNDVWPDSYLRIVPRPIRPLTKLALIAEFRRMSRICRMAHGLTAVSEAYLAWALKYAGRIGSARDRVFVLGFPTPPQEPANDVRERAVRVRSRFQIPTDAIVAAFVGIFGSTYDLETVVRAARRLASQRTNSAHIVLAGDGEKAAKLKAEARGLTNLTFAGWLDQDSLRDLLTISAIGLATYTSDAPQSMPYKPFEYMASGVALVSSLGGELGELVESEKLGMSYRAGDAASLAGAIAQLCARPEARQRMGANGRRIFAERFSDQVVYPALIEYLQTIVNGARFAGDDPRRSERLVAPPEPA